MDPSVQLSKVYYDSLPLPSPPPIDPSVGGEDEEKEAAEPVGRTRALRALALLQARDAALSERLQSEADDSRRLPAAVSWLYEFELFDGERESGDEDQDKEGSRYSMLAGLLEERTR